MICLRLILVKHASFQSDSALLRRGSAARPGGRPLGALRSRQGTGTGPFSAGKRASVGVLRAIRVRVDGAGLPGEPPGARRTCGAWCRAVPCAGECRVHRVYPHTAGECGRASVRAHAREEAGKTRPDWEGAES